MKLYDGGKAPSPRRVRIYLAEKGISVDTVPVDMNNLGHRSAEITALNPLQRLPVLVLDDGMILTETVAICRYFEALHPDPPLMGTTPLEIATIEMWNRRMELNFYSAVGAAFRHLHPAMKEWEVPQIPEWGEANKPKALSFLEVLDKELADREFIAGDSYTIADITGVVSMDFMKPARIPKPEHLTNVMRWYNAVKARPSTDA
jgi:glutathione S-transferase